MTNTQFTFQLYELVSKRIQYLEAQRDYENGLSKEEEKLHKDLNKIWDMIRDSPFFFEPIKDNDYSFVTSNWIKKMFTELNIKQADAAKELNTTPQQISAWINGSHGPTGTAQVAIYRFIIDNLQT